MNSDVELFSEHLEFIKKQVVPLQQEQQHLIPDKAEAELSARGAGGGFFSLPSHKRRSVLNMKLSIFHAFLVEHF